MSDSHQFDKPTSWDRPSSSDASERIRGAVTTVVGGRFVEGNQVQVLKNGDEIFPEILTALSEAEHSIDFLTFVYWTGDIAQRVAHHLSEKARSGVRVRVLLDAFGSSSMDESLIDKMREAGAIVERFRPIARWKFWENDHRTHRKIIVIDEKVGFTGGVGIAAEWEGDARNPNEWRDTHFRLEGPVVLDLKAAFLTDWRDTQHPLDFSDSGKKSIPQPGEVEVAVIDGSAQIGFDDAERVLEALIGAARERILLQTPYFNPSDMVLDYLKQAVGRGVEIHVLIPGPHIDKRVSKVMANDMLSPLIDIGVKVWIFEPTMMHVKAVLVDGAAALVGSINVNRRSMLKDEEAAIILLNEDLTAKLETQFADDLQRCRPSGTEEECSMGGKILTKVLQPFKGEI